MDSTARNAMMVVADDASLPTTSSPVLSTSSTLTTTAVTQPLLDEPHQDTKDAASKDAPGESGPKTVDSFLRLSWYCARVLLLAEFMLLGAAGNMVYMVYAGAAPHSVACVGDNFTVHDVCKEGPDFDAAAANCTIKPDYEFLSLNVEFGYFCKRTALVKSAISVQMIGVLLGSVFWGYISDSRGRKTAMIICFSATAVLSLANSLAPDLLTFTAIRAVLSFFNGGCLIVYGVYKMEHVPRKHRFLISTLIAWSPNFIVINGLAYMSGDWRTFQQVIFLVSCPAFLIFFVVYESPRWLIQQGRIAEARTILVRMQKIDGVSMEKKEDMKKMLDEEHERYMAKERKTKRYNLTHLFRHTKMAVATMILSLGVFFCAMISYALMFNIEKLAGSLFLNNVYLGLIRWSINIISGVMDYNFVWAGRKLFHTTSEAVVALCLFMIAMTQYLEKTEDWAEIVRAGTLLTAAFCSQIFISKGMTAMEYFPTVVRNSAISFKSIFSRMGGILAPQIFFIPSKWLPYFLLALLALVDCVAFAAVIPETKGIPLPETLPEKVKKLPKDILPSMSDSTNTEEKSRH